MAQRKNPFKRHRFPRETILTAVRCCCRYPLSCRDARDMLAERGVTADAFTIHCWVRKFGPKIRKWAYGGHCSWRGMQWHVDETYVRVGGRWCYLWRAVDQFGQLIDFHLTARRNGQATRAFLRQAQETVRPYRANATTDRHPVRTCRMWQKDDAMTVVSPQLRAIGCDNLRVVDASPMPEIVSGATNGPSIMIGGKGADLIRGFPA